MKFVKLTNDFKLNLHINVDAIESIWEENCEENNTTYIRFTNGYIECVKETPEEIMEMIKEEK